VTVQMASVRDEILAGCLAREVDANGLRHRVLTFGSAEGQDLVFVPGITSPAESVQFIAEQLPEFRIHVPDLRGRGRSDKAPAGGYRLEDYRTDLDGLIAALDLSSPTIVGHSLGARIAAKWAVTSHTGGSRVVLVDPPTSGPGRAPYPMSLESFQQQLEQARLGTTSEQIRTYFPAWPERELRLRAEILAECDPTAVAETHYGFEHEDFFDLWAHLSGRVTLIRGDRSPVVPSSAVTELRTVNSQIAIHEVSNAGHMVPWDNLPGFVEALRYSLASID
jgi:N-formylmaleamate deformylase